MSYPLKEQKGISKNKAHITLQQMEDQLRFIDQKLKVHVDREVWIHFQKEIHQIDFTKSAIEKMRA
ncbi:hypothetical protein [Oceanobacillus polygoni]|uniref:Uncharacterized protein n=1 Tax=Oceanobacillus polygoni TaxID=1235259 RepID=A0A9X1CC14_9BACI|nr:hypothetical protein [Oceanobacillus polygoni]MBP2078294.1 hypothetical protein [Oceanobacillus polygoni]